MKFLQNKPQNKSMNTALWLIIALTLQSCAIMDIKPKAGFPETIATSSTTPRLLPSDAYDFHNNPRL